MNIIKALTLLFSLFILSFLITLMVGLQLSPLEEYRPPVMEYTHNDFISKIKKDRKIDKNIKIIITPAESIASMLIKYCPTQNNDECVDPTEYKMTINPFYYSLLNSLEKKALISHEIGHIGQSLSMDNLQAQIEADNIAAYYVGPNSMIGVIHKGFMLQLKRGAIFLPEFVLPRPPINTINEL